MRMYSDIQYQRVQNLAWSFGPTIVYTDFDIAIHNTLTTVWLGCEVKASHFHVGQSWWPKIQSLWLSKQNGSKSSEVSQFLKKIFEPSLSSPSEVSGCFAFDFIYNHLTLYAVTWLYVQSLDFICNKLTLYAITWLYMQSSEWQASGTVLRLPSRTLYWCRLQFFSACLVWMLCIIILGYKRMWVIPCPFQCTHLQWAS
jgi:hypothetical protein